MPILKKKDSSATGLGGTTESKPSLWQQWKNMKKEKPIPEADYEKYLGMTREEINGWADHTPGVGKNQLAGKVTLGAAPGLAGAATGFGYGGWGPGSESRDANRGMKFPPQHPQPKKIEDDSEDDITTETKK